MRFRGSIAWTFAALWAVFAAHALVRRIGVLGSTLPDAFAPAAQREALQSGDAAFNEFLTGTRARLGGAPRLLVLAHDPARNDLFQFYRAAYVSFPQRVWYVPVGDLAGAKRRFSIHVGPELSGMIREQGLAHAAYYHRPDPAHNRWFALKSGSGDEVVFEDLAVMVPGAETPDVRGWAWVLGVLSLFALGLTASAAIGLDAAFRDDVGARLGLGFVLGVGVTAWLMELLSFARMSWSPALVWSCWLPIAAYGGWRLRGAGSTAAGAVAAPGGPPSAWGARIVQAGPWLFGLALVLPAMQVLVPVSAWGNWDAWAVWAFKAKACLEVRGLPLGFLHEAQYKFSHPDYPLGVPAVQTYLALVAGGTNEHLLRLLSLAYAASLAGLLAGALRDLGAGRMRWFLCGAFMLTPKIQEFSSIGYMDLPAACHMTACLAVLIRAGQGRAPGWTLGVLGGMAALVKDEGLVWGAGCVATLAAWTLQKRVDRRHVIIAAVAMGLLAGPWKATVRQLGLKPNDYAIEPARMMTLLPERLPMVVSAVLHESLGAGATVPAISGRADIDPGPWYEHLVGSWGVLWLGCLVAGLLGWRAVLRSPLRELGVPLILQSAAYTGVFLASTWDLPVHLVTTVDRLLLQLSPAVFLLTAGAWFATSLPDEQTDTSVAAQRGKPGRPR